MNFIALLTLSNSLAVFAFFITLITIFSKQIKTKNILLVLIGIAILSFTIIKNNQDILNGNNNRLATDSSKKSIEIISHKLDTLNNYVLKLNSEGIIRDSVNNEPKVTNKFFNSKIYNSARQEGNNNIQNNKFNN